MKYLVFLFFAVLPLASQAEADINLSVFSQKYDIHRNPFDDARAALKLAQQTNRNVFIEIGGDWCTWCHRMDEFLAQNPKIKQQLHQNYVLLKVNVSDANENTEFMKSLPPVLGYPHIFISTAQGKMVVSKDTAELQDEHGYSAKIWQAFLTKWQVKNTQKLANKSVISE